MNVVSPTTASDAPRRHQLLLVREADAQHSGSGCCGRLGGEGSDLGGAADFGPSRKRMEQVGVIYRELAEKAPDLDLVVVDPRNFVWLYPTVWRAARSHGAGVVSSIRAMAAAGAPVAVVLDGEPLYSGKLPAADTVVKTVLGRLEASLGA